MWRMLFFLSSAQSVDTRPAQINLKEQTVKWMKWPRFSEKKKQSNKIKPGKSYNTCRYFSPAWRSLFVLSVHHVNTCAWFIKRWLGFRCIAVNQRVCSHHYSISEHLGWYEHKWTALSMSDYAWHYASPRASQVSTCDPDLSSSLCMQIITYCTLIHFVKFIVWHLLNLQGDRNN